MIDDDLEKRVKPINEMRPSSVFFEIPKRYSCQTCGEIDVQTETLSDPTTFGYGGYTDYFCKTCHLFLFSYESTWGAY